MRRSAPEIVCLASMPRWLTRHGNAARLAADVPIAFAPALWSLFARGVRSRERWLLGRRAW